jgi:hypothetical protein
LELHHSLLASSASSILVRPFGQFSAGAQGATPHSLMLLSHEHNSEGLMARIANHPHTIHYIRSTYVKFLMRSRKVFSHCMITHGVPIKFLEPFWLHTVVHAVDHYQCYKLSMFWHSLMNESLEDTPTWQIFSMHSFRVMFKRPHLNQLLDNRIKNIRMPFYQDLYKGLAKIDLELADQVTASVMY